MERGDGMNPLPDTPEAPGPTICYHPGKGGSGWDGVSVAGGTEAQHAEALLSLTNSGYQVWINGTTGVSNTRAAYLYREIL